MQPATHPSSPPPDDMLTIVIPALDEEASIGDTIVRCLDACSHIRRQGALADVEIIVVSDGSTDRTVEIARQFHDVQLIEFQENRGYGAAIKEGWRRGRGSLLGFLDADGTCDPVHFGDMCRIAKEESADVVLGSRLGPGSKMPVLRRVGNRLFALLLGLLCGRRVTDTASGMRVVRRQALKYLYPLPDGLHFTPSMSARALLNDLRVIEIPMTYEERVGSSKLSVLGDGLRFLRTIFEGVLCYRPERVLLMAFAVCVLFVIVLAAYPTEFYLKHGRLEEWMIYRFVACSLLGSFGLLLLLSTAMISRVATFGPRRSAAAAFWPSVVTALFRGWLMGFLLVALLALSLFFLWPGIVEYATSGHVTLHWSRLLAGAFTTLIAMQTAVFALLFAVVSLWMHQRIECRREEQRINRRRSAAEQGTVASTTDA
ncbi:MAG: glycosyltransferase family 2 protein [Pirellulales bacterium]